MTDPKDPKQNPFIELSKEEVDKMQSEYAKEHGGEIDPDSDVARAKLATEKLAHRPINTKSPESANIIHKHEQ